MRSSGEPARLLAIRIGRSLQPCVYRFPVESPVPTYFVAGEFSFLRKLVKRRLRNLQIRREFGDRHDVVAVFRHFAIRMRDELTAPSAPSYGRFDSC